LRFGEFREGFEPGWRYCRKCQGLFTIQYGLGVCPKDLAPHDATNSREFFMRLAGLTPTDPVRFRWTNVLAIEVPVLIHAYITLDLEIQSSGTCTWQAHGREVGLLDCQVRGAVRLLDCFDQEPRDFLTFSTTLGATISPTVSSADWDRRDFSSAWIKENWLDLSPGAKPLLVPSATPFPLGAALLVGGLAGAAAVVPH
jgi:hypothetical protein